MTQTPTIHETHNGPVTVTEVGTDTDYQVTFKMDRLAESTDAATQSLAALGESLKQASHQIDALTATIILAQWINKKTGKPGHL